MSELIFERLLQTMNWYVLRSKPHKEFPLYEQVVAREIECFFPRVKANPVNPRAAAVRPYFPSYLFVKADLDELGTNTFTWMPYAQGLVCFDGQPAEVPQTIIIRLQNLIQEINAQGGLKPQRFKRGDRVRVKDGPFEGYEGIFDSQLSGTNRVRVLLKLLSDRQMPVEMNTNQITNQQR